MSPLHVRLKAAREAAGISQAELARRAKTPQATISLLERSTPSVLHLGLLERLAKALGITPLTLLADEPRPRKRRAPRPH